MVKAAEKVKPAPKADPIEKKANTRKISQADKPKVTVTKSQKHVIGVKPPAVKEVKATSSNKDLKDQEIQQERTRGQIKARGKGHPPVGTFLSPAEAKGRFGWLTPMLCEFFNIKDVAHQNNVSVWNFPPSLENPKGKKKHQVFRKYYYQLDGKFLMVDAFDDDTKPAVILKIKAWMEALGFRYTYFVGGEGSGVREGASPKQIEDAEAKFRTLLFKTRLEMLDPKSKDYPEFHIPQTYKEAGFPY